MKQDAATERPSQEFRYGWIGPRAAMAHLGLGSLSALYRLINEWRLPHGRMGRLYRFRRAELDEWLTKHRQVVSQLRHTKNPAA